MRGVGQRVHVAVAAIVDRHGDVLVTRRHAAAHQGGLWEFPGGKCEAYESVNDALARELHEELGIRPLASRPLIRIAHDYPDKQVLLDTWRVDAFAGEPVAREGQPLKWVAVEKLHELAFPPANRAIISALQLPPRLLITPERGNDCPAEFVRVLRTSVRRYDLSLVQLRARNLGNRRYLALAQRVLDACTAEGARLLLNRDPQTLARVDAHGLHLRSTDLAAYDERPIGNDKYLSVAVHNRSEIALALRLAPDFALLSPVMRTTSHANATPLGWQRFRSLTELLNVPVFALGGLQSGDLDTAHAHGAQGIAAISAFWN